MADSATRALRSVRTTTQRARRAAVNQALAVREARLAGASWRQIGEVFGTSAQAAHNRWSGFCTDLELSLEPVGDRLLNTAQVASMLGIDVTTFRVLPEQPPTVEVEGQTYYRQSAVSEWVGK